ncbi:hypothetical protein I6N89_01480 [Pelagibaca abyssi]|nr:hypothetical protein [Salipiger abyssi]
MLRQRHDPARLEAALADVLGTARARYCVGGFEQLMALLHRHGWHAPLILPADAQGVSDDERSLARFVLLASEQDRDLALAEATMLVTPQAILPLVAAGERMGLPLLCEECRERLRCPLTFQ